MNLSLYLNIENSITTQPGYSIIIYMIIFISFCVVYGVLLMFKGAFAALTLSLILTCSTAFAANVESTGAFTRQGLQALDKNQPQLAIELFKKAIKANESDSCYYLGRMYETGAGVQRDIHKALALFQQGAKLNNPRALNQLGLLYLGSPAVLQDFGHARTYIKRAAEVGLAEAQFNYASLLLEGKVVEMNPEEANSWLHKAAKQSYIPAQLRLARDYQLGVGIKKDDKQAFNWYNKAALHGDPLAQYEVGLRYEKGLGIKANPITAHMYFNLSLAQDYRQALPELRQLTATLSRKQLLAAQEKARNWRPLKN